jgi:colicin import membrane protein
MKGHPMDRRIPVLLLALAASSIFILAAKADERRDLIAVFKEQVSSCYILPIEARGAEPVVLEIRLKPNGTLDREPEVVRGSTNSLNAKAALRAVNKCAPFQIPKKLIQRYSDWRVMRIQFNTTP